MDMGGNDSNLEQQKESEDPVSYCHRNNLINSSVGIIPMGNTMDDIPSCSSAPMVDSFCPLIWDHPINSENLGYCDVNIQNDGARSSVGGMDWRSNAMLRGGMFSSNVLGMLPQNLPSFPSDSGFIERGARFSCFSGGNFSELMNLFHVPDPLSSYHGQIQGLHEVFGGNGSKPLLGIQSQRDEMNVKDVSKETKVDGSGNECDEGCGGKEELDGAGVDFPGKGIGSKKRKRTTECNENSDSEGEQISKEKAKETLEINEKDVQSPKSRGKNGKQGSQGSDQLKEEYIHIRARKGQATNSHSLAERVRREKISERMKFLQDLVPGCSKVTGKTVMLDEIINYVQSLQRQVEFLSMKLATMNSRLDFNMEGLLTKDILHQRAGLSSSLQFPPDMTISLPHLSHPGLTQAGFPGSGSSSETLRRPINIQSTDVSGGFKEPISQVPPSGWEDELHNVVHMGFNSSGVINSQDLTASLPPGHMKTEP